MTSDSQQGRPWPRRRTVLAVVAAVLATALTAAVLVALLDIRRTGETPPADAARQADAAREADAARQADVAERGREVMPFDLDRSTHRFSKTGTGGRQTVTVDEPVDQQQVGLIREHLRAEAERFRRGDFADPARIHGAEMPGLAELRSGAARIRIDYRELTDGAQLDYLTAEPALLRALHAWFDAQVSDHGRHAEHGGPATPVG